jgi:predicted dehydrogenase
VDRLRVGIAGIGNVATLNVAGYAGYEPCDLVAFASPGLDKAKALAETVGVETCFASLEEMLEQADLDAVELLTPTYLHHEHVLAALDAGLHVSCQKPLCNTVGEARELAAAAERSGKFLRVTECFYHYPPLVRAKEILASGAIGDPIGLRIKTVVGHADSAFEHSHEIEGYLWRLDTRSPGGHLFDDMIHKLAMAEWLVDLPVTRVRAVMGREDTFFEPFMAIMEYDNPHLRTSVDCHYAKEMPLQTDYYSADEFFEIQGTKGLVFVTRCTGKLLDLPPLLVYDERGQRFEEVESDWGAGFRGAAHHFVDSVLAGVQPDMAPDAAIRALQLVFAVYESARSGEAVVPAEIDQPVLSPGWPG